MNNYSQCVCVCVCVALLGFTQDFGLGEGGEKCSGPVRTAGCVIDVCRVATQVLCSQ